MSVDIVQLFHGDDLTEIKSLLVEFKDFLINDQGVPVENWQGFQQEIDSLPGKYSNRSKGLMFVARLNSKAVGSVFLRQLPFIDGVIPQESGEVKRLYVIPEARGLGISKKLMETLHSVSKAEGYKHLFLDTLERLNQAVNLYKSIGYKPAPAYCENPMHDVVYLMFDL